MMKTRISVSRLLLLVACPCTLRYALARLRAALWLARRGDLGRWPDRPPLGTVPALVGHGGEGRCRAPPCLPSLTPAATAPTDSASTTCFRRPWCGRRRAPNGGRGPCGSAGASLHFSGSLLLDPDCPLVGAAQHPDLDRLGLRGRPNLRLLHL